MLPGLPGQSLPIGSRQLGERQGEILQDDAAAARQRHGRQVTEAAAEPQGGRRREPCRQVRHTPGERYAERRRRSRMSSTKMGISERKITIPTTIWMWSPMFGTAAPSRYPAHVMLVTQPMPPATL